jgi:hypothetical protein
LLFENPPGKLTIPIAPIIKNKRKSTTLRIVVDLNELMRLSPADLEGNVMRVDKYKNPKTHSNILVTK